MVSPTNALNYLYPITPDVEESLNGCTDLFKDVRKKNVDLLQEQVWLKGTYSTSKVKAIFFAIFSSGILIAGIYFSRAFFLSQSKSLGIGLAVVTGVTYTTITLQNTGGFPKSGKECSSVLFAWFVGPFYPLYKNLKMPEFQERKNHFYNVEFKEFGAKAYAFFDAVNSEEHQEEIIKAKALFARFVNN